MPIRSGRMQPISRPNEVTGHDAGRELAEGPAGARALRLCRDEDDVATDEPGDKAQEHQLMHVLRHAHHGHGDRQAERIGLRP